MNQNIDKIFSSAQANVAASHQVSKNLPNYIEDSLYNDLSYVQVAGDAIVVPITSIAAEVAITRY